jgi:hypothetical protein
MDGGRRNGLADAPAWMSLHVDDDNIVHPA